jgi:hypothetical protein
MMGFPYKEISPGPEEPPPMKDYELIALDYVGTNDRVARITLNRPDKMNALSQELMYECPSSGFLAPKAA